MPACPFATQKPVAAHGGPITEHLGIVIHVTAGEGDPYNEFANPANQVSSHFGIGNGQGGMADGACLVPEHRVLTADLRWVPGGSLVVGDRLVGFNESVPKGTRRQFGTAVVEAVGWADEHVFGVVLDDEQVIYTTADHRWLAQRNESWIWRYTKSDDKTLVGARVPQLFRPWHALTDYDAGWFAGLLDGEGTLTAHHRPGFSQRPTMVLDRALHYLDKRNISYTTRPVNGGDCQYVDIQGSLSQRLEILGSHRPIRLLDKVDPESFGQLQRQRLEDRRVIAVYPAGVRQIVKVQTSMRTFIAEGYPMHNCEQYVDTNMCSWAQMAGNSAYISVETEGEPTEPLTPAQVATFAKLYAWLHATHGVPFVVTDVPGQTGFITHGDGGQSWGGHFGCPGPLRAAQRAAILDAAAPAPSPAPPTPPVTIGDDMQSTTIQVQITDGRGWCACPAGVNGGNVVSVIAEVQAPPVVHKYVPVPAFIGISSGPNEFVFEGACPDGLYGFIVRYAG